LLRDLGGTLGSAGAGGFLSGGLTELLDKFKQSGHGTIAQSWIDNGPNQQISPPDLKQANRAGHFGGFGAENWAFTI
jgi:uncharacterized protein YidB (DUF937 family)